MWLKCYYMFICIAGIFKLCYCQRRSNNAVDSVIGRKYMVYFVQSLIAKKDYDTWLCGGALVSPSQILTAAACLVEAENIYAIAGYKKYVSAKDINNDKCTKVRKQRVVKILVPTEYKLANENPAHWINVDVGVAIVEKPYNFTDLSYRIHCSYEPQPIFVNFESKYELTSTRAIALGWGNMKVPNFGEGDDTNSQLLQEASTVIVDKKVCTSAVNTEEIIQIIDKYLLCASSDIDDGIKDFKLENQSEKLDICKMRRYDLSKATDNNGCPEDDFEFRTMDDEKKINESTPVESLTEKSHTQPNNTGTDGNFTNTKDCVYSSLNVRRSFFTGPCQNGYGSPLIRWIGDKEVLIGVTSNAKKDDDICYGPFLYVSTAATSSIIKCLLETNPMIRKLCNQEITDKRYEVQEIDISWPNFPDDSQIFEPMPIIKRSISMEPQPLMPRPTKDVVKRGNDNIESQLHNPQQDQQQPSYKQGRAQLYEQMSEQVYNQPPPQLYPQYREQNQGIPYAPQHDPKMDNQQSVQQHRERSHVQEEPSEQPPNQQYEIPPNQQYQPPPGQYEPVPSQQHEPPIGLTYESPLGQRLGPPSQQQYEPPPNPQFVPPPDQEYQPSFRQPYGLPQGQQYEPSPEQQYEPPRSQHFEPPPDQHFEPPPDQQFRQQAEDKYGSLRAQQYEPQPVQRYEYQPPQEQVSELPPGQPYVPQLGQQYIPAESQQYPPSQGQQYEQPTGQYEPAPGQPYEQPPNQQYKPQPGQQYEPPSDQPEPPPVQQYEPPSPRHRESSLGHQDEPPPRPQYESLSMRYGQPSSQGQQYVPQANHHFEQPLQPEQPQYELPPDQQYQPPSEQYEPPTRQVYHPPVVQQFKSTHERLDMDSIAKQRPPPEKQMHIETYHHKRNKPYEEQVEQYEPREEKTFSVQERPQSFDQIFTHLRELPKEAPPQPPPQPVREETFEQLYKHLHEPSYDLPHEMNIPQYNSPPAEKFDDNERGRDAPGSLRQGPPQVADDIRVRPQMPLDYQNDYFYYNYRKNGSEQ